MKISVLGNATCDVVRQEASDRVSGVNGWFDQHNHQHGDVSFSGVFLVQQFPEFAIGDTGTWFLVP